jgi:hypothetical protein
MNNWTVISQPIKNENKGLITYLNYLVSSDHKNHRNKTRIVPIHNSVKKLINYNFEQITDRNLARKKAKKGGRNISSYCQSFVFSLPPDIQLNDQQWKNIAMAVFCDLADHLGVSKRVLANNSFINLHDQDNQHINLVVSKVINGVVCRDLQRKAIIAFLKQSFNAAVLKLVNIDNRDYQPQTSRAKRFNKHYFEENKVIINALHSNQKVNFEFYECNNSDQPIKQKAKPKRTRRFE